MANRTEGSSLRPCFVQEFERKSVLNRECKMAHALPSM